MSQAFAERTQKGAYAWTGGGTGVLVADGWYQAKKYASDAFDTADGFLKRLEEIAADPSSVLYAIPDVTVDTTIPNNFLAAWTTPPTPIEPGNLAVNITPFNLELELDRLAELELPDAPEFSADDPGVNTNVAPPNPLLTRTFTPPSTELDAIPEMPFDPLANLPAAPTPRDVQVPDLTSLSLPTFSAVAPADNLDLPDVHLAFSEEEYSSSLLTAAQEKLVSWIVDQGTGLKAEVERAIYERARAREHESWKRSRYEALDGFAARGFTLPGGALADRLLQIESEAQKQDAGFSRDVAIKQAEMEVENLKFAMQVAFQYENMLVSYTNNVAQRAFDLVRVQVEFGIRLYEAKVTKFNALLQAYQAEAQVYATRLEAETKKLEQDRLRLEAAKLKNELNLADIQIYREKIGVLETLIKAYNSQLERSKVEAEIVKTQVEAFQAEVMAYRSEVEAKNAEWEGYAQRMRAELVKAQVYGSQAEAYSAQVRGYQSMVEAKSTQQEAEVRRQTLQAEVYRTRLAGYQAEVDAETKRVAALADVFETRSKVYSSQVEAESSRIQAESTVFQLQSENLRSSITLELEKSKANVAKLQAQVELLTRAIEAGGQIASSQSAAALSAVNLNGSLQESVQATASTSYDLFEDLSPEG